ncbi:RanGTP-binding protein-domain-containing protein [Cercophora newfieldiana]|uniref:RanGTP-binding protein-domain-containing protein n=1 Tax=Cercophora newfieldiana TaxID=92897 RepID=A0AA39XW99_9PEZI|nr:RanGTP-binding protein-domain-containing protein [Cercophora newfieldiana]
MDALVETVKQLGWKQAQQILFTAAVKPTVEYTIKACSRLLKGVDDKAIHAELKTLQKLLDGKVKIISPSIDLIEFKSGRGNVFLESAVPLAKALHRDIIRLGKRLDSAATSEENLRRFTGKSTPDHRAALSAHGAELLLIIEDIKGLLARIDRDVPSMLLAITNSGEKMNSALSPGMSPSRMMQASWFLNFGDFQFASKNLPVQIGPAFTLSLYMLFRGHAVPQKAKSRDALATPDKTPGDTTCNEEPYGLGEGDRKPIWQEVMHKARVRLCRVPIDWTFDPAQGYCPKASSDPVASEDSPTSALAMLGPTGQYSYHLEIIEDLDDGRAHDEESATAGPYEDIPLAGIRESIPIYQLAKIFYTDTGRLLNIRDSGDGDNNPILLLKRDASAKTPNRLREEWLDESEGSDSDTDEGDSNDQLSVDRQLREESEACEAPRDEKAESRASYLPKHVDPEWLALEVYMEDEEEEGEDEDDEDEKAYADTRENTPRKPVREPDWRSPRHRSSVDSDLMSHLRRISLQSGPSQTVSQPSLREVGVAGSGGGESTTGRSPFGPVVTSLSLLEMLIRLTSLQEFQQTPHLSIPDHILTFFLEETSTTGLQQGEAQWALRNEAKRRVGFDPYADTPNK